jgi:branched-chain amino acid aminotransferase
MMPQNAEISVEYAYFEGQIVPLHNANISIKTPAFLYGTSLFEGIRGYWVPEENAIAIFRMKEHYVRLLENSKMFYLTPELSLEDLLKITTDLIQKNNLATDTYIRPTLYKAGNSIAPTLEKTITEFCLWTQPLGNYLDINKALNVCVSNWRRVEDNSIPPRAKAGGAYMNSALAVTDARKMGYDDAIVLTEAGTVSEGSAMNLFIVKNGKLITPAKTENILEGITRNTLITLAQEELGIDTEERVVDRTELYTADEAFFCGTGAQIAAIGQIDQRSVGSGEVGPITKALQNLYFEVVRNKIPKYSHWCTMVKLASVPVSSSAGA